jgi:hypothetical protein
METVVCNVTGCKMLPAFQIGPFISWKGGLNWCTIGYQGASGYICRRWGNSGKLRRICKIWSLHGGDYEESRLLGYKKRVHTPHQTYYVSATDPSRLILCKIWGLYGGDYEESRLLGYKKRVHTSHQTYYVSATEPSRLMLCKIWDFHGGDYEECRLLGCYDVWLL